MPFEILIQVCRFALLAAFLAAAIAKLRSPEKTLDEFTQLGVPSPEIARYAIPVFEIAIAAGLIVSPPAAGIAAFVLLVGFTTTLAAIIASGRTVSCACFGAISTEPIGKNQLYRNFALLAMALVVALS